MQHIIEKLSTRARTLLHTSLRSEVWTKSYVPSKSRESHLCEFRDFHLGVPGQKGHLDVACMERCRVYYERESGGFPQVRVVVSLVCPNCPWFILTPKVLQLCINHFVLVLCRSVWVIEACHFFLVPSQSSNMPLYLSIVLRARECASIPCSFVVFNLGLTFESFKELGGFIWYKEIINPMGFDLCNCFLKIRESIRTPIPKMRTHLGVWVFIPSHFLTLPGAWDVIPRLPSWLALLQALALVASPRLKLQY